MPDYQGDFDTRIEEMETEQLLRRVKYHLEHPEEQAARAPAETSASAEFENLHLGNEMYFQLDYAAKIYDPRTVPANTRFRKFKELAMRVMRLYATRQVEFNATVIKLLNMFQDRFEETVARFNYFRASEVRIQEALGKNQAAINQTLEKLAALEQKLTTLTELGTRLSSAEESIRKLAALEQKLGTRLSSAEESIRKLAESTSQIASRIGGTEQGVKNLATTAEGAATRLAAIEEGFKELNGLVDDLQLRNAAIAGVFDELKEKLRKGEITKSAGVATPAAPTPLDDLEKAWQSADYELFEDESRGDVAEIRERLSFYVPLLEKAAGRDGLVVDLGCGRGELLALLKEKGLKALGIDNNQAAVLRGQKEGLAMKCCDLFAYLRECEEGTLSAVTAMHVIEHLTAAEQGTFLALALKALKPGGLLALETPNIMNLHVASCEFYSDVTHVRPVHPVALRNRMKQMGYKDIDIRFLHPFPAEAGLVLGGSLSEEAKKNFEKLNDLIWGCRDCVILATKKEKL